MEPIQVVIVVAVGVALLASLSWITKKSASLDTSYYKRRWSHVKSTLKDGDSGKRLAIIDADKLLDHALKARKMSGSSMGERLRSAEPILGKNYQDVWDAHKLRNRLVHEEVKLKGNEVRFAMNTFERALKNVGAL